MRPRRHRSVFGNLLLIFLSKGRIRYLHESLHSAYPGNSGKTRFIRQGFHRFVLHAFYLAYSSGLASNSATLLYF